MMQTKLSFKLFGAFFLILAIVVGAMVLSRYIFSLSFKHYIRQVELEKLQRLVPVLQEEYITHGNWKGITADPHHWRRMIHLFSDIKGPAPPPQMKAVSPDGTVPPRIRGGPQPRIRGGPQPKNMSPGGPPSILLMDAQHRPILGIPEPNDQRQLLAIEVDGQIVGWLGLHKTEPFTSGPPAALLKRQTRHLYLLAGVVIGLTALIAFMFSRHLLKPIHRLIRGTRKLSNRNFNVRIEPTTRDELGQLAENFNAMAHTLENFEKMRRQWLTDISHELRTPLAILRGEIEALQDGVRNPTPQTLASLHTEILWISKLVEDLHLLSVADSDRLYLNKQLIFPQDILKIIMEKYQARFSQCQINVTLALSGIKNVRIKGDADRLEQVFTNILENACKYVRSPGALEISGQSDDRFLTLYFQDSGPGVPDEALPRLFNRLYRVDTSRNRDSGGSGLGLSICRHIIKDHEGSIWAKSSAMGGLSIGIKLPLTQKPKGRS